MGRVSDTSFWLQKRIDYRSSFQTVLRANLSAAEGGGTLIVGEFAMHPFVRVFMGCWFAFIGVFGGLASLGSIAQMLAGTSRPQSQTWAFILVPPFLLAFGVGLLRLGRTLAQKEARFVTAFLVRILDIDATLPASETI